MEQVRIAAGTTPWKIYLRELWVYRDLLLNLLRRDLKVRYVQTALGFVWAFLQPVSMVALLTLVFSLLIPVETSVPYALYAGLGWVCWSFFAFAGTQGAQVMVQYQQVIKKVWFPRALLPLSKAVLGGADLLIGLLLILVLLPVFGHTQGGNLLLFPLWLILLFLAAWGIGMLLASLSLRFRDLHHALPQLFQLGFFLTPVAYPAGILTRFLPEQLQFLVYLNPAAGIIEGIRESLLGVTAGPQHIISIWAALILWLLGLWNFRRVERRMADEL